MSDEKDLEVCLVGDGFDGEYDDANIPVNLFIIKVTEDTKLPKAMPDAKFYLSFGNFMPRKGLDDESDNKYFARTKEALQHLIKTKVLPYYESALKGVKKMAEGKVDSFYYWEQEEDQAASESSGS